MNGSVVFSANKKRVFRVNSNKSPTTTSTTLNESVGQESVTETLVQAEENNTEIKKLLSNLQTDTERAKSFCSGIKDDLKTIQVLAGVSTGASSLGTLASGGALTTGIIKNVKDKKIEENKQENNDIKKLLEMSDVELERAILSGEVSRVLSGLPADATKEDMNEKQTALQKEIDKDTKLSQTLGNVRTGLMAGSIATSATSTITSGISIKKLDDLMDKMRDCDTAAKQIKSSISQIVSEIDDTDDLKNYPLFEKAENIVKSCSGFDTANIKEIKSVMTASTVIGGIGAATSIAGTITSVMANSKNVRNDDSEAGVKKEKGLNVASNVMAGISTGTSAGGIVLGAVVLSKLAKNVENAEKCEDALK